MRTIVLLFFGFASGCSLTGLDDVELPRCQSNAECAALNDADGIDTSSACELWQCAPATERCAFGPRDLDADGHLATACGGDDCDDGTDAVFAGAPERCDALDNDCDDTVDEDVVSLSMEDTLATGVDLPKSVSWSDSSEGSPAAAWATEGGTGVLLDLESGASAPMSYARELDERNLMKPELDPQDRCPAPVGEGVAGTVCDFREVALAEAADGGLFVGVIQQRGCSEGQLRIGRIDDRSAPRVLLRGPEARSNAYLGIDLADDRACTGGSRGSGVLGAARLAMASHPAREPEPAQALLAWLATPVDDRPTCGGEPVDVEVLGAFDERGRSGGTEIHWVTATNDGQPQVIGESRSGSAPAVGAWPDRGTFVAFPDAEGAVALHFVPLAEPPAPLAADAGPGDTRPTEPLTFGDAAATVPTAGQPAESVRLAVEPVDGNQADLHLVFVEGCGRADATVRWATLRYDRRERSATVTRNDAVAEGRVATPAIARAGSGVLVGYLRDGEAVVARRFQVDGTPIDASWVDSRGRGTRGALHAFVHDGAPRLGFLDQASSALMATGFACEAMEGGDAD